MASGTALLSAAARAVAVAVSSLVAALDRWQARRQALRQLHLLDRRTLRDIGIDRSEVMSIAFGNTSGRRRCDGDR
jgi:uncharacterized protein YjiS (DUF1127 family)